MRPVPFDNLQWSVDETNVINYSRKILVLVFVVIHK